MKLNNLLLTVIILQTQAKETRTYLECFSKVDCKVLDFVKDGIASGKVLKCNNIRVLEDAAKCQLEAFGLSGSQAELSWKISTYTNQCIPKPGTEYKNCTVGCIKQKDRDTCLENCALPLKVKSEECLEKLAGMSTSNSNENAKCLMSCDQSSFSEIFDCQYNCHKDVVDALVGKASHKNY